MENQILINLSSSDEGFLSNDNNDIRKVLNVKII